MDASELPKCRLCGGAAGRDEAFHRAVRCAGYPLCACSRVWWTETDWRRLHGPRVDPATAMLLRSVARMPKIDRHEAFAIRDALTALGVEP